MHCKVRFALVYLSLSAAAGSVVAAPAALPEYPSFQLQARSNVGNRFNLPSGASISNATVDLNDAGRVVAKINLPTGIPGDIFTRHVFVGANGAGFVVSEGPAGSVISDPRVDPNGKVWFAANVDGGGSQAGVYRYDPDTLSTVRITGLPVAASFYTAPRGNAAGQIGYRADFATGNSWVSFAAGSLATHAAERSVDPLSIYSELYVPSFDENQLLAGKLTLFSNGFRQIRTIDSHGVAVVLAVTTAENAQSPYLSFDDAVALSPSTSRVAFIAGLAGGARGVYRVDAPGSIVEIARTGTQGLSAIEDVAPAINDDGLVAFRGVDSNGKQAIYIGDDSTLRRVIGRGDPIATDLGPGQIDQDSPGSSAFSGGVAVNASGDIAFSPALTPLGNNQVEWGTGIYIARAGSQLVYANGFEGP